MNLLMHSDARLCGRFLSLLGVAAAVSAIDEEDGITLIAVNDLCRDYYWIKPLREPVKLTPANMAELLDGPSDPDEIEAYLSRMKQNYWHVFRTGRTLSTETDAPRPDGSIRWARNTLTPLYDGDRVVRILVTFVDVTELRRRKEELESSLTDLIARDVTVCQDCQRVEENGAWLTMGEYMQRHSRRAFSHSICAQCLERYFGEHQGDQQWKP